MTKHFSVFLLLIATIACDSTKKQDKEEDTAPPMAEVPPSYLNVRINYPVNELEKGINHVLPNILIDGGFPMKDNRDTLYLTIRRSGDLEMKVNDNQVSASIPIDVTASVKKRVMGITFSNRDSPVMFSGTATASAIVNLAEDWNFDFICTWEGFQFKNDPKISFMGMNFNVSGTIDDVVNDYRDHLSDIICRSLRNAISFDHIMSTVWADLQSTHQIAQRPRPLYIRSAPVALNGTLIPKSKDTLAIHLEYRTRIHVSPENRIIVNKVPLNDRGDPLNTDATFLAYPELYIPYSMLEETLKNELKGERFQYDKYQIKINEVAIRRKAQALEVELLTEGDIEGKIYVKGKPFLNEHLELTLTDFKYQIDADNDWLKMTDFALHQFAEDYLAEQIKLDLTSYFNELDEVIMNDISRSPIGSKLDLRVSFDRISSYNLVLGESGIQWILFVEGKSSIDLKAALLK